MARLERPSRDQAQHLPLPVGERRQRVAAPTPAQEPRDDRGIHHRLAVDDPPKLVHQGGRVRDALLQQVADALAGLCGDIGSLSMCSCRLA